MFVKNTEKINCQKEIPPPPPGYEIVAPLALVDVSKSGDELQIHYLVYVERQEKAADGYSRRLKYVDSWYSCLGTDMARISTIQCDIMGHYA